MVLCVDIDRQDSEARKPRSLREAMEDEQK